MDVICKNRVKAIRKSTGLSQAAFSKKFGIPLRTIESWETGDRQEPDYTVNLLEHAVKTGYSAVG